MKTGPLPVVLATPFDRVESLLREFDQMRGTKEAPSRLQVDASDLRSFVNHAKSLAARLRELEGCATAWVQRPIAEAPQDGTPILVNDTTDGGWVMARWVSCPEWSGWVYDDDVLSDSKPLGPAPTVFVVPPPAPA